MQICVTTLFMANIYRPAKLRREKILQGMYFTRYVFLGFPQKQQNNKSQGIKKKKP